MNTVRSVGYGWGVLIVAGAGSYYFAKRSVNADRADRAEAEEKHRQQRERMRVQEAMSARAARETRDQDAKLRQAQNGGAEPSRETAMDTAAHAEPSPYEASKPFRSRKGDRFS